MRSINRTSNMENIIYKAKPIHLPMFVVFTLLFIPIVLSDSIPLENKLIGLFGFFFVFLFAFLYGYLTLIVISKEGILTVYHFIYIKGLQYSAKDIVAMEYGNLFKGGLGAGKGLNIIIKKNGREINTSIGEDLFGKEAIQQIQAALTKKI